MSYQKKFEEAFNIIAPEFRKRGLTDDEIRWQLTNLVRPTPKETSDMTKELLEKLNKQQKENVQERERVK